MGSFTSSILLAVMRSTLARSAALLIPEYSVMYTISIDDISTPVRACVNESVVVPKHSLRPMYSEPFSYVFFFIYFPPLFL